MIQTYKPPEDSSVNQTTTRPPFADQIINAGDSNPDRNSDGTPATNPRNDSHDSTTGTTTNPSTGTTTTPTTPDPTDLPPPPNPGDFNPTEPGYVLPGRPETPNASKWYRATIPMRGQLRDCVARVLAMSATSSTGGIQALEHSATGSSTFNNLRSMDWAVWELLIILGLIGYGEAPHL